ncbi:hypothetical protein EV368DRAFT_80490 [Lentinula lateritia]|uniref:Uncharacterized protein n=1 Tax=Lentinula aff. lateritia TaxID=2804960 RepID=A0ACC1U4G6_9AGAR|nr:hypothetical protein F5876DRAFT_75371 [Lentinula aff. lateritia]KAJ3854569.1 hypothetical protein EV368DRAFT_80490 [Lentinula lateritia]
MDPMNIALLFLWLFLYNSTSLAQSDFNPLDLSINPTITIGQSFNATWKWNSVKIPDAHPLIVIVGQNNQASTTTSIAGPGVNSGVVHLQVSETGSFQATLAMPFSGFFWFPPSTITQIAQFVAVSTALPDTIPSSTIIPLSTTSGISQISRTSVIGSGTQSLPTVTPLPSASSNRTTITPTTSTDSINPTQQSATSSPTVYSDTSTNSLVGVILGAIFGSLSAFLILAILVYCVWRHRRRSLPRRNTLSDLNSNRFYPNRMSANSIPSVEQPLDKEEEANWDAYTESSLAPSDSVSRAVWSFSQGKKKVRPLATSTTLATQSSTAANDSRESKPDATTDSGRYRSANANVDLPYKIPMIIMTAATPSPPSTTVS